MPATRFRSIIKKLFVVINIITALLFLAGCYNSWFNPISFWFIGFLTLASFYFLLLLILFLLFWLFAKPRFMLISIIAILLAWVPLTQLIKLRLTPAFAMNKNSSNIRIMSWNVENFDLVEYKTHPETKVKMLELVQQYNPDVACFQEMVASDSFPKAINFLPDFAAKFSMPYYNYSYNKKLDFDTHHHFGIITFSKYPVIDQHTLSYMPNDYNSIFQYTDILKEGDTFRIINLHLQSLRFSKDNLKYLDGPSPEEGNNLKESLSIVSKLKLGFIKRQQQSDRIRKVIDESPYPVIVCGDFNDVPNSYAYSTIGKNLKNAFSEKGSGFGRTFTGISPTLRIDNIFTDKRFSVEQFTRVPKKLSDHFPVITDVFYNKTNGGD